MTNDEAKFLLMGYRPDGRDSSDHALIEALAQVKHDPALATWFAREQAHATVLAAKLREIEPPRNLRDTILAGMNAGNRRTTERRYLRGWRRNVLIGLAAGMAVLLAVTTWWKLAPVPGATFDEFAGNFVDRGFLLQERGPDLAHLRSWLSSRGTPVPELPSSFDGMKPLGCRTLEFNGREVSLICFQQQGKEFHVFIARRINPSTPGSPPPLELREHHGHLVTAWSDATNDYVLVSNASRDHITQVLES